MQGLTGLMLRFWAVEDFLVGYWQELYSPFILPCEITTSRQQSATAPFGVYSAPQKGNNIFVEIDHHDAKQHIHSTHSQGLCSVGWVVLPDIVYGTGRGARSGWGGTHYIHNFRLLPETRPLCNHILATHRRTLPENVPRRVTSTPHDPSPTHGFFTRLHALPYFRVISLAGAPDGSAISYLFPYYSRAFSCQRHKPELYPNRAS